MSFIAYMYKNSYLVVGKIIKTYASTMYKVIHGGGYNHHLEDTYSKPDESDKDYLMLDVEELRKTNPEYFI